MKITQVGISEVVYNQGYMVDTKTAEIFAESGVKLRQFSPPTEGLVDLSLDFDSESYKVEDIRQALDDDMFVRPLR